MNDKHGNWIWLRKDTHAFMGDTHLTAYSANIRSKGRRRSPSAIGLVFYEIITGDIGIIVGTLNKNKVTSNKSKKFH